jgi:hypothetical protein|tara:strand:+ start:488 stop:907 length:420 start_codon:yes stop_codon:yes gene_type:complete
LDNSRQHIIKEIAQELDCGFDCYYNSKTDEVIGIPNFAQMTDEETFNEAFGADLKKIETQKEEFIKFEVLESFESFKIMERFVEQLSDKNLQSELENVLANKKPFKNFKYLIDHSDYRQDWFDFKLKELEKTVESQLNR